MFEKIISKNTEDAATPRTPPAPRPEVPSAVADTSRPVPISAGQRNVLGADVVIKGEVRFHNDLVVDGRIEGKITSEGSLTIGTSARIKAEIVCGSVIVQGRVEGNITVTDRVDICANAEVIGDIKANSLVMEAGAIYVGASTIGTPKNRPAKVVGKAPQSKQQKKAPAA